MRLAFRDAGSGSPVVLLHGLFGSARNLGGLARALAPRHRVVSMDLRNHGESGHDPVVDYATLAADVVETMDSLGLHRAALAGHSMGGKVAMRLALTEPSRVDRLVVADIAPVPYASHFGHFLPAMLSVPAEASRQEADAILAKAVAEPLVRSFLLHNFRPGAGWRIGLREIAATLGRVEDWDAITAQYGGPALFVTGARSEYVRPEDHAAVLLLFPHARFVSIANAGHWLHAEQPVAFNAAVGEFLAAG